MRCDSTGDEDTEAVTSENCADCGDSYSVVRDVYDAVYVSECSEVCVYDVASDAGADGAVARADEAAEDAVYCFSYSEQREACSV